MRKQTKIAAIVSAATLLAIGASMTSFAGWVEREDGEWEYQDRYGYVDTDAFHRGDREDNKRYWYYVGPDGVMLRDELFQYGDNGEWYYAHSDGRRATNEWVEIEAEDDDFMWDEDIYVNSVWYYFGASGKAVRAVGTKYQSKVLPKDNGVTETGKFVFDDEGRMMVGLVKGVDAKDDDEGSWYYCAQVGDSYDIQVEGEWDYVTGQALNGWAKMELLDLGENYDDNVSFEDDRAWYYFDGCKMITGKAASLSWEGKKNYYYFGKNGAMWPESSRDVLTATNNDAIEGYVSDVDVYVDDGVIYNGNGWVNYSGNNWYYIVNVRDKDGNLKERGVIFNSDKETTRMKMIDGKLFAFDKNGKMITGKYQVSSDDFAAWKADKAADGKYYWNGIEYSVPLPKDVMAKEDLEGDYWFYFNDTVGHGYRGQQEIGKVTYDVDGESVTRYFRRNGVEETGVFDGYLFVDGELFAPVDGDMYRDYPLNGQKLTRYRTTSTGPEELTTDKTIGTGATNEYVIVDRNGRPVRRSSTRGLTIDDGRKFKIDNYVATPIND